MVKDHGRAEDITQEVFISALRRMRETDRAIAFKPWIYEIAKNACIDQFRRSRRAEEVSMDAGDGLGQADHGRLVAAEPTPDDAVDAKQQLDHLCGAFGGLSDSHHEILVLREFEGLSYREIGDRMGLSRPGVESTLFRARKRLTEEYDELVSGQRCVRIQSIISAAGGAALGTRDQRRLARHVSHCQPCRRMAMAAGLDVAAMRPHARPPRDRARRRRSCRSRLPALALLRRQRADGAGLRADGRRVVEGRGRRRRRLIVAGVGAGVAPHAGGKPPALKPDKAKPAAAHTRSARRPRRPPRAAAARRRAAQHDDVKSTTRSGGRTAPRSASRATPRPRAAAPARERAGEPAGGASARSGQPDHLHAEPDAGRPGADRRQRPTPTPSLPQVQLPRLSIRASARPRPAARSTRPCRTRPRPSTTRSGRSRTPSTT